jgi:hypothetical protein
MAAADRVRIRLLKKFALMLNGIDLNARNVGDVFCCPRDDADLLIREGWAELLPATSLTKCGDG